MQRQEIPTNDIRLRPFDFWATKWALLASGDFAARRFNCMTIGWGSLGVMWGKPFAMVVVRPQRYTFQFMEQYDSFTVCAFPEKCRQVLDTLGSRSGRSMDKINASGLTPMAATKVASPAFEEAELIIECRKMYFDDLDPKHFLADFIAGVYKNDYHRMYFGEIVAIQGTAEYRTPRQ